MNTSRINYVAAGGFVAIALVGMIISIALLTGRTGSTDSYHAVYNNVTGVKFGTLVLYEGYPIGQVEQVVPVAKGGAMRFKVDFTVNEGWKIPDDSLARIGASGLLSAITINIDAGKSPHALKPGSIVKAQEAADLFAVVGEMAGQVSNVVENDIRPLLASINKTAEALAVTVSTVGNLVDKDGTRMIKTFASLADNLKARLPVITNNVEATAANFAALSKDLSETRGKLDMLLSKSQGMIGENRGAMKKSVEDLRHVTASLARHIDAINQNVEGTARNMYEFSREIRKNPGLLLSGAAPKDKGGK